jgi:DNA-binding transcriptional LysR family regulator
MFGRFGLRFPLIAGAFLAVLAVLGAVYYWSPQATLRITTVVEGGVAHRFISTFISETTAAHPRIRFETVTVPDLRGSAKALEDGKVNIAMVRSDLPPPANGDTLVTLRRDVVDRQCGEACSRPTRPSPTTL